MNLKKRLTSAVKKKATEFYESASPKVQAQIEKLADTKIEETVAALSNFAVIGFIIFSVVKAVNGVGDDVREKCITYNEVHITNNYFYGKDENA